MEIIQAKRRKLYSTLIEEEKSQPGENKPEEFCYKNSELFTDYFTIDFRNKVLIPSPAPVRNK
jgi:hypothetical protein